MDLTELGFGGKNSRAVGSGLFISKLVTQLLAHKLLPFVVPKPAFMSVFMDKNFFFRFHRGRG